MTLAYFDCFSGAGGDMIVGALVDAGLNPDELRVRLMTLGLEGFALSISKVKKQGFAATRFEVRLDESARRPHRHLHHIRGLVDGAELPDRVHARAMGIFERLAEAEARVHGTTVDQVHFHEVGAVDAVLDIVGACLALDLLRIDRVICSPIPVGSGTVRCEHGLMPVPAPATAELLKGVPLAPCDEPGEWTTPTAAAVLTAITNEYGPMPAMSVQAIGYGAGSREGPTRPNLLRVFLGETREHTHCDSDGVLILETNLDDASPQLIAHAMDRLFEAGALDVFAVPIVMKKSRPGTLLTVISKPADAETMERIVFSETPTFGLRRRWSDRSILRRRIETVNTRFGSIRIKIGERTGCGVMVSPEYEDCKAAAVMHHVALREVISVAEQAWRSRR